MEVNFARKFFVVFRKRISETIANDEIIELFHAEINVLKRNTYYPVHHKELNSGISLLQYAFDALASQSQVKILQQDQMNI